MLQTIKNKPFITADVCVIEEQDEHLVLAVRLPRAAIEANQDFLAYLGGVSAEAPAKSNKLPLARFMAGRVVKARQWAAAASLAFLSIALWEFTENAIVPAAVATVSPAFVWGSARFVNDVVPVGGTLEIIASHKYLKACDWSITRFWYQDKTLLATAKVALPAIKASPEFSTQKWPVELPHALGPGDYNFKATLHGACSDETIVDQEVFEQNFQVIGPHETKL